MSDGSASGLGNRVWRVTLPDGRPAIQKLFRRRRPVLKTLVRTALTALARAKTSPTAAARCRTEAEALRRWREVGCDVPELIVPRSVGMAAGGAALLMEDVSGPTLLEALAPSAGLDDGGRAELLRRYGAAWGRRHRLALELDDPLLVQEHGTLAHVLVCGDRLVAFDLEQVFRPGRPVLPLVTKEVLACLRSLAKAVPAERFAADLAAIVDGYDDDALLGRVVGEALHSPHPLRRLVRRIDAWQEARSGRRHTKRALVTALQAALDARRG